MFFVRKRSANVAAATSVFVRKRSGSKRVSSARKRSGSGNSTRLVTQAFSQDVKFLARVPLFQRMSFVPKA
ncbi:hypothetical protein [Lysinibacillus xylanilyticus]|uniref:hypothetical protein n=1 Tax=Lysinibacillus xylanilyticus TaxID=582475 RepID=UPI00380FA232